ncbi:MAG: response regulator [Alphaproteobacteria bacterium]|nr:response regulator [Alphaproteobacteria bacterium SS10]
MARILVAEDDSGMRRFIQQALERAGHAVEAVGHGDAAMAELKTGTYDLLLTDVAMPGVDGVQLARHAADNTPGMQIMMITGFAAVALRMGRTANGNEAPVMSRPFHLRRLVEQVDDVLSA